MQQGVITPIISSEWAAPTVPILKKDGFVKTVAWQASKTDSYPLAKIKDLLASLAGGKLFSKLNLANAYQQIPLEEASRKLGAINTYKGLFQYNWLPYGISTAPLIFQRSMETFLEGLPGVYLYLVYILITGKTDQEHLTNLSAVLQKLPTASMKPNPEKSLFMVYEVEDLGHKISATGLQPTQKNFSKECFKLKSFLGMLNYYSKFLPNLSMCLTPLYPLLQKDLIVMGSRAK